MDSNIKEKLEKIYSQIPSFDCKHCNECCGPVIWFEPEEQLIKKFMINNNIKRVVWNKEEFERNNMKCPYLKDNRCIIYPVRPLVCRLQGVVSDLKCKQKNKQKNMSDIELKRILGEFKKLILETGKIDVFYCTKKLSI